ncbi:MAG: DUF4251 domain-containing protein, partial [Chitinophagaceae bacterium]
MKTPSIVKSALIIFALATIPYFAIGQNKQVEKEIKEKALQEKIQERRFIFNAQNVLPMRGRNRNISTDNYTLQITPDTIIAYLPYFGRAYVAPMDPSKGGIQFTSIKFQ